MGLAGEEIHWLVTPRAMIRCRSSSSCQGFGTRRHAAIEAWYDESDRSAPSTKRMPAGVGQAFRRDSVNSETAYVDWLVELGKRQAVAIAEWVDRV
jgi:hypothetical protein